MIKVNFLIITFDFPPTIGGVETRARNYIKNLVEMGHSVEAVALTIKNRGKTSSHHQYGATIYRCPTSPLYLFRTFFSTLKAIGNSPIDVVHLLTGADSLIGLLFLLYGKLNDLKTGIFLYGKEILSSKNNLSRRIILHLSIILAGRVGVNSKATAELLPKHALHKLYLLYPGADIETSARHRVNEERGGEEKNVLFVGRLIKRKGADDLLQSFKLLLEKMPQTRLTIVGDGPQRKNLRNLAEKLEVHDKVEFTGILRGRDLYRKYQECDVFVMPSKRIGEDVEGFGMVFLEAGFFKKPSVGTRSGGIPEAVVHNETGILVPEGDVIALKKAIETLLTNQKLAQELGANAHKRVIDEFTWEKATLRLIKIYS